MKGSIGFCSHKGWWIGDLIQKFTKSKWNHTFVVVNADTDKTLILEAEKFEVRLNLLSYYNPKKVDVEVYAIQGLSKRLTQVTLDKLMSNRLCQHYGWLQILGLALILPLRVFGLKLKNPFRQGIICSELVHEYLDELGIKIDIDRDTITPADIHQYVTENSRFKKIYDSTQIAEKSGQADNNKPTIVK